LWGGEVLHVGAWTSWARAGHLRPLPLLGGEAAVREPRRVALALLYDACGESMWDADTWTVAWAHAHFSESELRTMRALLARPHLWPPTTSAGRLFDGVASLLDLCDRARFEGQAAMRLESLAAHAPPCDVSVVRIEDAGGMLVLDWRPLIRSIVDHRARATAPPERLARAFHAALAGAIARAAARARAPRAALTGGVFQNALLLGECLAALRAVGIEPLWHRDIPPNDGGISVGQAVYGLACEESASCA
jgi:hydrogenase maturation protein HypF